MQVFFIVSLAFEEFHNQCFFDMNTGMESEKIIDSYIHSIHPILTPGEVRWLEGNQMQN